MLSQLKHVLRHGHVSDVVKVVFSVSQFVRVPTRAMARILAFIQEADFDPDATDAMGEAFDMACAAVADDGNELLREVIAKCILSYAQQGERDPNRLCEAALATVGSGRSNPMA